MAKNSIDAYGAKGKTNLLTFDPDDLVIVAKEKDALYDARGVEAVEEEFVLNIMKYGILQPIVVRKNVETGKTEVVAGRRRVLACREANKRLKKQGGEPHQVPATIRRGPDVTMAVAMVIENENRKADSLRGRAEKMQRLIDMGKTEDEVAVICGTSRATVRNSLALLEVSAVARRAIETGKVPESAGYKLAKMTPEEQKRAVAKIERANGASVKSNGHTNGVTKRRKGVKEALGGGLRGKREIQKMREKFKGGEADMLSEVHDAVVNALSWVLGEAEEIPING
jgi:ParB family chromosome partitioning protein